MNRPSYLALGLDELERRAAEAYALLGPRCVVCPRGCKVDRREDVKGLCAIGRQAVVASHFPHFGEEDCLRGRNGSGTIFFSGCNLRCVFCQNHDISWEVRGERVTPARLAAMMLELQAIGCHNVNWVTPEHVVPQILESLPHAVAGGLELPIVYNTSSYDSLDSLRLMDGIVDVYMPDFKVWTGERARRYLKRPDYAEVARETDQRDAPPGRRPGARRPRPGPARRDPAPPVMPGQLDETAAILQFVADELGTGCYVNLMAQYYVSGKVGRDGEYMEIARGARTRGVRAGARPRRGAGPAARPTQRPRRPLARRLMATVATQVLARGSRTAGSQCDVCPRSLQAARGPARAVLRRRACEGGEVVLTTYGRSSGFCVDPIEKKPSNHFLAGSSVAVRSDGRLQPVLQVLPRTGGDLEVRELDTLADAASPEDIARAARSLGCACVAFTYNDPVIFLEYAIDVADACRRSESGRWR